MHSVSFKKNARAFTLIEVLIALMIIAIALAAALRATNNSVKATTQVQNTLTAHWVALNVLSQIQTNLLPMTSDGNTSGGTIMLGKKWDWKATQTNSAQFSGIKKITVTVDMKNKPIASVSGYAQ